MVFMENETKIFVAWLIKYVKNDKKITGKKLAEKINCDPTTISSYVRRRTKPDYETRAKILDALKVSHKEMMDIGRAELSASIPTPTMTATATARPPDEVCPTCDRPIKIDDVIEEKHGHVIKEFDDKEWALEINRMLVDIEKYAPSQKSAVMAMIKGLHLAIPETQKKTGTGD